jgi:hypothetical protein
LRRSVFHGLSPKSSRYAVAFPPSETTNEPSWPRDEAHEDGEDEDSTTLRTGSPLDTRGRGRGRHEALNDRGPDNSAAFDLFAAGAHRR